MVYGYTVCICLPHLYTLLLIHCQIQAEISDVTLSETRTPRLSDLSFDGESEV